jgi:hypothetical protein
MSHVIYTHYLPTSEGVYAGICFFNFEMYPNWRSSTRRLTWLQSRSESGKFREPFCSYGYMLEQVVEIWQIFFKRK